MTFRLFSVFSSPVTLPVQYFWCSVQSCPQLWPFLNTDRKLEKSSFYRRSSRKESISFIVPQVLLSVCNLLLLL